MKSSLGMEFSSLCSIPSIMESNYPQQIRLYKKLNNYKKKQQKNNVYQIFTTLESFSS